MNLSYHVTAEEKYKVNLRKKKSFAYVRVMNSIQSYCLYIYNIYIYNMAHIYHIYYIKTTCRDIQTVVIKTCAYTNRYALKCAFGEEFNEL